MMITKFGTRIKATVIVLGFLLPLFIVLNPNFLCYNTTLCPQTELDTCTRNATIIVDKEGNGNYTTITEAMMHSNDGDIIFVNPGIYEEYIVVNKSVSIIGCSEFKTIVINNTENSVFFIWSENCNISHLAVINNFLYGKGITIFSDNNRIFNCTFKSKTYGIYISDFANNNEIFDCAFLSSNRYGIYLVGSYSAIIRNNVFSSCGVGLSGDCQVELYNTHSIAITNLIDGHPIVFLCNSNAPDIPELAGQIILVNCTNVHITDRVLSNCSVGISIIQSKRVFIKNVTSTFNYQGALITYSEDCTILYSNFSSNEYGLIIQGKERFNIENSTFMNNRKTGLKCLYHDYGTISNCTIIGNSDTGIEFDTIDYLNVSNCLISNNKFGIDGEYTHFSYFDRCCISNNELGIGLSDRSYNNTFLQCQFIKNQQSMGISYYSSDNIISGCVFYSNRSGLYFSEASHNKIIDCSITGNINPFSTGIHLEDECLYNLIDGCEFNFKRGTGIEIDTDCEFNKISNSSFMNHSIGIVLDGSFHTNISNVVCKNTEQGIKLINSCYTAIDNCTLKATKEPFASDGICIDRSSWTTIIKCEISDYDYGITVQGEEGEDNSENNTLTFNSISNNSYYGIKLDFFSSNNTIHHNFFLNNNQGKGQACVDNDLNQWDNGSVGNYWTDWLTPDRNHDNIVDVPYIISGNTESVDRYPFIYDANFDSDKDGYIDPLESVYGTNISNPQSHPTDMDKDKIIDVLDNDRDGDGVENSKDKYPDDPERPIDQEFPWVLVVIIILVLLGMIGICFFLAMKFKNHKTSSPTSPSSSIPGHTAGQGRSRGQGRGIRGRGRVRQWKGRSRQG